MDERTNAKDGLHIVSDVATMPVLILGVRASKINGRTTAEKRTKHGEVTPPDVYPGLWEEKAKRSPACRSVDVGRAGSGAGLRFGPFCEARDDEKHKEREAKEAEDASEDVHGSL